MSILSNCVPLSRDDEKARSHILKSLKVCSGSHTLSHKLLARVSESRGRMFAIFGTGVDLGLLTSYGSVFPVPDDREFRYPGATSGRHSELMARFVVEELNSNPAAVVVCEDWMARREDIESIAWARPPRVACFGDSEVYHLLTPDVTDAEILEDTVRPGSRYQTGVCSTCESLPDGDIPDEGFFDEVVRHARHLFVPAFDGSGYLIRSLV